MLSRLSPYRRVATNLRVPPQPFMPSFLQSSQPTAERSSGSLSQRYLMSSNPDGPSGSHLRALPYNAPTAGLRAGGIGEASIATISSRALRHGSDPVVGNVDFDDQWIASHLAKLEVTARQDSGDKKGKAFLDVWVGIREAGLCEKKDVHIFIAQKLMNYPWYEGNDTIREARRALRRLEYINAGLLAKKHLENSNWYWNQKFGDVRVHDFWRAEETKLRQKVQAHQAQGRR